MKYLISLLLTNYFYCLKFYKLSLQKKNFIINILSILKENKLVSIFIFLSQGMNGTEISKKRMSRNLTLKKLLIFLRKKRVPY